MDGHKRMIVLIMLLLASAWTGASCVSASSYCPIEVCPPPVIAIPPFCESTLLFPPPPPLVAPIIAGPPSMMDCAPSAVMAPAPGPLMPPVHVRPFK